MDDALLRDNFCCCDFAPLLRVVRSDGGALRRSLSSCCLVKLGTKLNPSRMVPSAKKNPLPDAGIGKLFYPSSKLAESEHVSPSLSPR